MKPKISRKWKNALITLAFPAATWLVMNVLCLLTMQRGVIASMLDVQNYVRNVGISACTAMALSYNLGNGRFDLSLGAQRMMVAIVGGNIAIRLGLGTWGVILCSLTAGLLFGALVGVLFVTTKIPAMVLGVGVAFVYECVAFVSSGSQGLHVYGVAGLENLSNMYLTIGVVFAATLIAMVLDRYTRFGFYNRAIGGSQKIAHNCGVNIYTHAVGCYAMAGGLVSLSGVFDAAFKGSMDAELGFSSNSTVMTNCFPMFLGKFIARWSSEAVGIVVGTMTIRMFQTGLSVMQFSGTAQQVFTGFAFLIFLLVRANEHAFSIRRAKKARLAQAREKRLALGQAAA